MEAAIARADGAGRRERRAAACSAPSGALWGGHRDYGAGLALTRESVGALDGGGDRRALAEARARLGIMLLNVARGGESRVELESARRLFEELGDEVGQARIYDMLGMCSALRGDFERSLTESEEAARRLHALGDLGRPSRPPSSPSGSAHGYRDGWRAGEPWMRRALDLAMTSGARAAEAFARGALAQIALPAGSTASPGGKRRPASTSPAPSTTASGR